LSIFESTKQRFFGQILLSMKLPSLIPAIAAVQGGDKTSHWNASEVLSVAE